MARVYRARDPRLHRRVALKVLRINSSATAEGAPDATDLLLREARASAALDHPNAVAVFDVGEADGELFISMELVNGKSLRSYVNDPGVGWDIKLRWMVDAARALGAAHERGLVHRDVKPENIMVRSDGVVKVLDFGIAKHTRVGLAGEGGFDEPRTQSVAGGILGTAWYLSPEQLRGEVVDGRADQFAWAVTTHELLTGTLPWPKGVDGFKLVLAILNATVPPPSSLVKGLPSIADAVLLKALAKAPASRFEAMEFVVTALEGLTSPSRRSWADVPAAATTKTDPAPAMTPDALTLLTPKTGSLPTDGSAALATPRPRASGSLARTAVVATLALSAAAVAGLVAARLAHHASAEPAALVPEVATSCGPWPITALPPPRSSVPEALAAYRSFRQSFRDADWSSAMRALETAVARDPSMAAAQLRLAFLRSLETEKEGLVRTSFHEALRNRTSLDEEDTGLLDALEPYLQSEPSDPLEATRRLESLRQRWPHDAEIAYMLGSVCYDRGDLPAALEAFGAAAALDPGFAQALSSQGGCLAYLGRFDEARAALEDVRRRSPTATEALWYEAELAEQDGRCEDEEVLARAWLARDPEDGFAYEWLAGALAGQGKPVDAVRTALEQKWARLDPATRARREAVDRAQLDLMAGDFASAEARLRTLEGLLAAEPGAQTHAEAQLMLLHVAEESGGARLAREVATSYLARKDAWAEPHRVDDVAILLDPIPTMLGTLERAGLLSSAQRATQREEWLRAWRSKTSVGITAWAVPAGSHDEAVEALEALPGLGGPPLFTPTTPARAYLGRVELLAGQVAQAITPLRQGAASCTVLGEPIGNTRAYHDLGVALETGARREDRAAACQAYGVVLSRWGHARPWSVTAEDARARFKALGCR